MALSVAGVALLASLAAAMTLRLDLHKAPAASHPVQAADLGQDRAG